MNHKRAQKILIKQTIVVENKNLARSFNWALNENFLVNLRRSSNSFSVGTSITLSQLASE